MSLLKACLELLLTRRSIRKYEDREIPLDLVYKILEIARYAPSAKNRQPWRFIVIKSPELRQKLSGIHRGAKPLAKAPLGILVVCDAEEAPDSYQVDCANASMYIMLAAHAPGVGTVWIQALRDQEAIQGILGLPSRLKPVALIAMGWPAEHPEPKPRKTLEELVKIL